MSERESKAAATLLHLHETDNVAVLAKDVRSGDLVSFGELEFHAPADLGMGHKLAITPIAAGTDVLKYGASIGYAAMDIDIGQHVHLHNLTSRYTVIEDMEAPRT